MQSFEVIQCSESSQFEQPISITENSQEHMQPAAYFRTRKASFVFAFNASGGWGGVGGVIDQLRALNPDRLPDFVSTE
jgi:hypothetical protein